MRKLVFLVEEESMKTVLDALVPRVVPDVPFEALPHQGKSDLDRSIRNKLRNWRERPGTRVGFVIVHDQDSADCRRLKHALAETCRDAKGSECWTIRIVCHELESWYLGDLAAVERGLGLSGLARQQDKAQFRDPDQRANAKQLFRRLVGTAYGQIECGRRIGPHLAVEGSRSRSFGVFVSGVRALVERL